MILLTDNDILIKLAQCNLTTEWLNAIGSSINDCFILNEAQYSLQLRNPDKSIRKITGSAAAYERLCDIVGACKTLDVAQENLDLLAELSKTEHVDPGELALLLHAHDLYSKGEDFTYTSGDKRCLEGILKSPYITMKDALQNRVECTESIFLTLINTYGHDHINNNVIIAQNDCTEKKFDGMLSLAFGQGRDSNHACECLRSHMASIQHFIRI